MRTPSTSSRTLSLLGQKHEFSVLISFLSVLLLMCQNLQTCHANHMADLRRNLIEKARVDPHSRPVQIHNETINVHILFDIAHIHSLDEWTGTLTVNGWIKLAWQDKNLQWNPDDYSGLNYLLLPPKTIWQPDITLYNSARAVDVDHYGNTNLYVTEDGTVHWFPPVTFHTTCPIDHKLFPFDEHMCSVILGSWTYDSGSVNLILSEEHNATEVTRLEYFVENPQWELLHAMSAMREIRYDCCEDGYRTAEYKLLLRRRSPFYKFLLVVPSVMAMGLTLALFWLPPNAGEKVTLGGVIVIIHVALLFFLGWCIPPGGNSVPAIVLFCGNSLVMSGFSLIIAVAVINVSRSRGRSFAPSSLKVLTNGPLGRILCLNSHTYQPANSVKLLEDNHVELGDQLNHVASDSNHSCHTSPPTPHFDYHTLATAVDRICFIVYCVAFLIILVSSFTQ